MSASSAIASAQMLSPLADCTFSNSVSEICPQVLDASFQFGDIQDLGMIDFLGVSPDAVVHRVEIRRVRRP